MAIRIKFQTVRKNEIERIQNSFMSKLSHVEIMKQTKNAINGTLKKSISKIRKEVKFDYNVPKSRLKNVAFVSKPAEPYQSKLWGTISVESKPIPIIEFKTVASRSSGVVADIRKSKRTVIRAAFKAQMKSGHIGIFARGQYQGNKGGSFVYANAGKPEPQFLTSSGKRRITELHTLAPYNMIVSNEKLGESIQTFMGNEVVRSLSVLLQKRVDELAR